MINTVEIQIRENRKPLITITKEGSASNENSLEINLIDPMGNRASIMAGDEWLNQSSYEYTALVGNYTAYVITDNDYPGRTLDGYISGSWAYEPEDDEVYVHLNVDDWALVFLPCIYDRTQKDVDYVKELHDKWFNGTITQEEFDEYTREELKGALNNLDLRRIEYNMTYLADKLNLSIQTAYDRETRHFNIPVYFDTSYFSTLRTNLLAIYNTGKHYSNTPTVPDRPFNSYQKMNDIERILYDTYCSLQDYYYTGNELYAGQIIAVI